MKEKSFNNKQHDEVLSNYIKTYNKNDKNNVKDDLEIEKLFKVKIFKKKQLNLCQIKVQ